MLPVAIGVGEGGEFYRPLATAIIGGTITSTLLTLLVVPTFYDSIEIARDRMIAKYQRRAEKNGMPSLPCCNLHRGDLDLDLCAPRIQTFDVAGKASRDT